MSESETPLGDFAFISHFPTDPRSKLAGAVLLLQSKLPMFDGEIDVLNDAVKRMRPLPVGGIESERLREALSWAVGFIRCNIPSAEKQYPDMRNAMALVDGSKGLHTGEFHMAMIRAEVAEDKVRELEERLEDIQSSAEDRRFD